VLAAPEQLASSTKFGAPNTPIARRYGSGDYQCAVVDQNADKARDPEMHQTSRTGKEFTLGIGCENPVVFSSLAVAPLRIHSERPPALFEIETLASVEAASGNHYRPALLLRQAALLG
jgi:hypothetical protein